MSRTWAKTGVAKERLCNAPLKGIYLATCERYGDMMYGGRCWQHRPASAEDRERAKQIRIARHNLDERMAEAGAAKRRYDELSGALIDDLLRAHLTDGGLPTNWDVRVATLAEARGKWSMALGAMERAREIFETLEDDR